MRSWIRAVLAVALVAASCAGATGDGDSSPDVKTTSAAADETASPDGSDDGSAETTGSGQTTTEEPPSSTTEVDNAADGGGRCESHTPGSSTFTLDAGSVTHKVRVYLPAVYNGTPIPLVINWHGLGSNGQEQALFTDYERLAESEGFVVVHPTGAPTAAGGPNGWELAQLDQPNRDDVAMASTLIDRMIGDYCVDSSRVYSTGMSNGGYFTSRLVCELSDRIAAAVSVAGLSHYDGCRPTRPVPFMAFHGTADAVVPYTGGDSTLLTESSPQAVVDFFQQSMPDEFAEFAGDFNCDAEPSVTADSVEVTRYTYEGCADGISLVLFEVADGGHTWPGSPLGPLMEGFVGHTTDDVSATTDGWAFMSSHSLDAG